MRILKSFHSLRNTREYKFVYENGISFANKYLVMYVLNNNLDVNRIGISVSKKVGNSVVRHRVTRLIRESYRLNKEKFNSGLDVVIIARMGIKGRNYDEVSGALIHLGRIHKILKEMI